MDNIPALEGGSLPVEHPPQPLESAEKVEAQTAPPETPVVETPTKRPQPEQPSAAQEAISVVQQTTEELKGQQPVGKERPLGTPPPRGTMVKTWPVTAAGIRMANERQAQQAQLAQNAKLPEEKAA